MKKQLLNKLYACLPVGKAFIATAMIFSASANAQILYNDIVPDISYTLTSLGTQTYNLDLNADNATDFLIKVVRVNSRTGSSSYVSITPQGSNAFITTTLNTVKKLVTGATIGSSQAWHDTTLQYLKLYSASSLTGITTNSGEWNNAVDCYVGLQLINGGQTYYGWVRMDVTVSIGSASMTIKDYAYNSIPNQPILAGQTNVTGIIENSFASSIHLFPNPATNNTTITLGSSSKKVEVTIADITGKIIYSTTASETQKIEVNTEDFSTGVYVVQIQTADFIATKKLVVEK